MCALARNYYRQNMSIGARAQTGFRQIGILPPDSTISYWFTVPDNYDGIVKTVFAAGKERGQEPKKV